VQGLQDQVLNGDTITLPAGTFFWATTVTITKHITIQGQTTTNSDTGVCDDQTILVDNATGINDSFFDCTVTPSQTILRITGITFKGGTTTVKFGGAIRFGGGSDHVRIDHCHFTGQLAHNNYIAVYSSTYGVADHLVLDNMPSQRGQQRAFNGTGYGDLEFSQTAGYGGSKFFFMEDCYINNTAGNFTASGGWDAAWGGKYVVRHCHLFNVEILCHGTEAGRYRGGRAYELYNNEYHWSYQTTMDGIRSGSMIAHDNTFVGVKPNGYGFQTYRTFYSYGLPWGGATGHNPWDQNDPQLYYSGTISSATSNTITDTTKNWAPNELIGFTFKRVSDGAVGRVLSNTSNTATVYVYNPVGWAAGQAYQIHRVPFVALDQPCRGAGDLITGDTPINSTTGTPAWPHQAIEPCYSWNNTHSSGGEHINWVNALNPPLQEGRDYYSDTPMPGYTPYTYPHPLVTRPRHRRRPHP
jgi:hypothetical protein